MEQLAGSASEWKGGYEQCLLCVVHVFRQVVKLLGMQLGFKLTRIGSLVNTCLHKTASIGVLQTMLACCIKLVSISGASSRSPSSDAVLHHMHTGIQRFVYLHWVKSYYCCCDCEWLSELSCYVISVLLLSRCWPIAWLGWGGFIDAMLLLCCSMLLP